MIVANFILVFLFFLAWFFACDTDKCTSYYDEELEKAYEEWSLRYDKKHGK